MVGEGVIQRCCGRRCLAHVPARTFLCVVVVVLASAIGGVGYAFAQTLAATPGRFGGGQTVTVSGTGFPPGAVTVWFDSNGNNALESGEPSTTATANGSGAFSGASLVAKGAPGTYSVRAGNPPIASTPVTIDTCWMQWCKINGAETICILGTAPTDSISDCKALDSSYSDMPNGYDFTNVGPRFLGATILAAATDDLGPVGTGCAAMSTAITAAESPPYFNQVPNKASLLAAACTSFPLSPIGFPLSLPALVGYLTVFHSGDPAVTDAQTLLGAVTALIAAALAGGVVGGPAVLPLAQYAMAVAAVDGAIACGFVDFFCNGRNITQTFISNPTLQASLIPTLPGVPVLGAKRWGDLIGWAQVVCTGNIVPSCPDPTPGTAGPNNSLAPNKCVTGKVVGISIGYDGDLSFDVNDGYYTKNGGKLDPSKPGPNVKPLVNYHNFLPGPGGSDAPGGVDVEIPVYDSPQFIGVLAQLRPNKTAVFVCGQFVTDMDMGWNELHPVTFLALQAFPLPPTGVTATASKKAIRISWTVLPGITYEIWRSVPKQRGVRGQRPRLLKANRRPPFDDTSATPGVRFAYFVRAVYPAGRSELSNPATATLTP